MIGGLNMNKVEKFEAYISKHPDMDVFNKERHGDTVTFKSIYTFGGSDKTFIIVLDDSIFNEVICRIVTLDNSVKRDKILYLMNDLNSKYKSLKYMLDDSGNIEFAISYISSDEAFEPEVLLRAVTILFKAVENDYSKFMRVVWA